MAVPTMPSHQRTISSVSSIGGVDDDLFHTLSGFDNFGNEDDDISFDDFDDTRDGLEMSTSSLGDDGDKPARKGKKQTSTAEKKATHNAVERARRESLNGRFLVLADMLPGMNHVKRASKAAIVNKSIALINDLQSRERRLTKENQALKAEIAGLKERWGMGANSAPAPGNAAPAPAATSATFQSNQMAAAHAQAHAQVQAQAQAQMQAHAAAMAGMAHHPGGFPMMHPAAAAAAMAHMSGNSASQQSQERSASLPNIGLPLYPGFPTIFNPMAAHEHQHNFGVKLEHGHSPSSNSDASHGSASHRFGDATISYDSTSGAPSMPTAVHDGQHTASPTASYCNPSPSGTVASLVSDKGADNKTATSPASSHSVPTPGNSYSPVPLPSSYDNGVRQDFSPVPSASQAGGSANATGPSSGSSANPALAAFDTSADAAYLATQFGPRELQKAQSELQAFIAYQQRLSMGMAAAAAAAGLYPSPNGGVQSNAAGSPTMLQQQGFANSNSAQLGAMTFGAFPQSMVDSPALPSPTASGSQQSMAFNFGQQQQQMHLPQPGMSPPGGFPAWQTMMMAAHQQQQQQGLTTYGGLGGQF